MSTNSRIGILRESGEVESIYCHWDGYPSYNGKHLLDHWSELEKLNELISLGDLSSLGTCIGEKHDFDTHSGVGKYENGIYSHTPSEAGEKGWCLFYSRDRGEEDVTSKKHRGPIWPNYGQEYEYLFIESEQKWYFRDCYGDDHKQFVPLTLQACEEEL